MFAIGYDFSAFDGATYREDSTGVVNIDGTITNDILADDDVADFKDEDPDIEGVFEGTSDQRVVLDLTQTDNGYVDIDFIAAINVNMDASSASKLYVHYKNEDNSIPTADDSETAFETGAMAVEITPATNTMGRPLDTFKDSQGNYHYDTRLVHLTGDATKLRYVGLNFNKQSTGGNVSVGRIIGGPLFIPDRQPNVGLSWGNFDSTLIDKSIPSAYQSYERGRRYRTLTAQFQYLDEDQAYEFADIFNEIGRAQPCFVIAHTENLIRTSMYCRIETDMSHVEDWIDKQEIPPVTFVELVSQRKG